MTTFLVTFFEPFDGRSVNASGAAVEALAAGWDHGSSLVTASLPVSFSGAAGRLEEHVRRVRPDVVVCVGEAAGRSAVGLERVALNLVDARIPDNDGHAPVDRPVADDGPTAYLSTLPLRRCLQAAQGTDVPVEISNTAGTYVCNATFYALMHLLGSSSSSLVRGGFVHVPLNPEQAAEGAPSLTATHAAAAIREVLLAATGPEVLGDGTTGSES